MKKWIYLLILLLFLFLLSSCAGWQELVTNDYTKNKQVFADLITLYKNEGHTYLKKDNYDPSVEACRLYFEEMGYEFLVVSDQKAFFCKTYDGMDAVGLYYTEKTDWVPTIKEKVYQVLDLSGCWMLYSEHLL